jgi:hypothetical protein
MRHLLAALIAVGVLTSVPARGETRDVTRFAFLQIEPGARPGGFGKSFTGLADDVNASYYNPGGLALQERSGVTLMHEPRSTAETHDMFYDYVAFAYCTEGYGTFCVDAIYSDAGRSEITDVDENVLGVMHIYDVAPSAYWSYPVFGDLGVGAGLTYAYQHLADVPGGVDQQLLFNGGVLYRAPVKGLSGGFAFTNLGPNKAAARTGEEEEGTGVSWPPPRTLRLGLAYKAFSDELNDLTVAADGSKLLMNLDDRFEEELGQAVYSGGLEYVYAKIVAVRAGYYRDRWGAVRGLTLGFGFNYKGISFDYGRVPEGEVFGDRHRFAVGYQF